MVKCSSAQSFNALGEHTPPIHTPCDDCSARSNTPTCAHGLGYHNKKLLRFRTALFLSLSRFFNAPLKVRVCLAPERCNIYRGYYHYERGGGWGRERCRSGGVDCSRNVFAGVSPASGYRGSCPLWRRVIVIMVWPPFLLTP